MPKSYHRSNSGANTALLILVLDRISVFQLFNIWLFEYLPVVNLVHSMTGFLLLAAWLPFARAQSPPPRTVVSTPFGTSYQVNVDAAGNNIPGDAANEPSLCIDPTNPQRVAVGWRQFDTTNSDFRQAGWGFSTNGGVSWNFGGKLQTNVFHCDPVLAEDAEGRFYYLSLRIPAEGYLCDMWRSAGALSVLKVVNNKPQNSDIFAFIIVF